MKIRILLLEKDNREIIKNKVLSELGLNKEKWDWVADKAHELSPKYSIWIAKSVIYYFSTGLSNGMESLRTYHDGFTWKEYFDHLSENYRYIIDWLQGRNATGDNTKIDFDKLTYSEAYDKAVQWHESLKVEGYIASEKGVRIINYPDGFYWIDLQTSYSEDESKAMGHCGRCSGANLYSLRKKQIPHVTIALEMGTKIIKQAKGRKNEKPIPIYHPYIIDFISKLDVTEFRSIYQAETDFQIKDLSKEMLDKLLKMPTNDKLKANMLVDFISSGDVDSVKRFVKDGIDPSAFNNQALMRACYMTHVDPTAAKQIIEFLLQDKRVDPSDQNNTALHQLVAMISNPGNKELIKLLLKDQRVDPSANSNELLHAAIARDGIIELVELILKDKRFNFKPATLGNPVATAAYHGNEKIVKLLLADKRIDPSKNKNDAIFQACLNDAPEIVKLLLADKRVDPSDNDNVCFVTASRRGHEEIVKLLIADERIDPACNNNEPIRVAVEFGKNDVVEILLSDKRIDPSFNDNILIRNACTFGRRNVVRLLLKDKRVDPGARDNFTIRWAARKGHREIVDMLLKDGRVDPTARDNYAYRWAHMNGYDEVSALLNKYKKENIENTKTPSPTDFSEFTEHMEG